MTPPPPVALTIAGSDPTGGAGLQADLLTFAALGVHGASVVAALTVQTTSGVSAVEPVAASLVRAQIEAVLGDLPVRAVKTGLLAGAAVVESVADALEAHPDLPLIVDPVLAAGGGELLMSPEGEEAFVRRLLPLATLLTPNLPEARHLAGVPSGRDDASRLAARILARGARAVLIKGGHAEGAVVVDLFHDGVKEREYRRPRLDVGPLHGTGCALSAAIAALLALGRPLPEAIETARDYVQAAIAAARRIGKGRQIPWAPGGWKGGR
jgi:hydroxymethylpyrimidine/phosphomethylpyrimidine kinase